jgi:hypothetical protein
MRGRAEDFVYQIEARRGQAPADIVADLTHAVWGELSALPDPCRLDPHLWPSLYFSFRDVFKNRLVRYPGCGEHEECRSLRGSTGRDPSEGRVYVFRADRDPARLACLLALLARRRLRPALAPGRSFRDSFRRRIMGVLSVELTGRLCLSPVCKTCPSLHGEAERRLWGDEDRGWDAPHRLKRFAPFAHLTDPCGD